MSSRPTSLITKYAIFGVCVSTVISLAACSSTDNSPEASNKTSTTAAAGAPFPVTISNCGTEQTFERAPERVVLMNGGSVAEVSTMIALGVEDAIVANAQNYGASDIPGQADQITALPTGDITLNNMMDIPREAMLSLEPDFVSSVYAGGFDAANGYATREELAEVGAATYVPSSACGETGMMGEPQTLQDSYELILDYGKIFGVSQKAEELIAESKQAIADIESRHDDSDTHNVMVVFPGMGADDFSSIGGAGIWNDLLSKAGATNPFDDGSGQMFVTVSKEKLASTDVDALVVVNYMNPDPEKTGQAILDQFPSWTATQEGNLVVLSDSIYLGPDNHIAVEKISGVFHGEDSTETNGTDASTAASATSSVGASTPESSASSSGS